MERKRIAITMGDPAGIGPEVVVKALANKEIYEKCIPVVIGDYEALQDGYIKKIRFFAEKRHSSMWFAQSVWRWRERLGL